MTTTRAQLDAELDHLASMLPPWREHLRHEAQFWPQFEALAERILEHAGEDDRAHVQHRLQAMLQAQGLTPAGRPGDPRGCP